MADLSTIWIRWRLGSDPEAPWEEVEIRTVSVRAAFAFLEDPPPPGTRGMFEERSEDGFVSRRGVCRVVFVRDGVGAGLELRRGVARGEAPAGPVSDLPPPPSSQFRRPKQPAKRPERPERKSPAPDDPTLDDLSRDPQRRPSFRPPSMHGSTSVDSVYPTAPTARPAEPIPPSDPPFGLSDDDLSRAPEPPVRDPGAIDLDIDLDADLDLDLDAPDATPSTGPEPDEPSVPRAPRLPDLGELGDEPSGGFPEAPPSGASYGLLPELDEPTPSMPPSFETYQAAMESQPPPPRASSQPPPRRPSSEPPAWDSVGGPPTPAEGAAAPAVRIETRTRGRGMTEGFAIGIDLGTSNTCASYVEKGTPKVIPTRYGTHTVPSVYARVGHRVLVGEPAVKRMILDPAETIYGSKRLIGRAYTTELAYDFQPYFAYELAETRDHRFGAAIDSDVVSFEEVATALLEEVRDVASRYLDGPIDRAVITVPAYFTEVQREAVKRAARAARLMVDQLVTEPTAAALAYGHHHAKRGHYVVFDLGGGTFDISVMRASNGEFEVLAIGGDPFLGGIDVDDMIANYLLEELHREIRVKVDPTAQQLARLREVAEECKRGLSVQESFAVSLKHFTRVDGRPVDLNATVSRVELERLAEPFVQRLLEITLETIVAAGLEPHDVNELLLVGGMSRMPLVHDRVERFFGRRADRKIHPDEAVALGAALLASRIREVRLLDVLPLSIGIAGEGRRFLRLVPRNTPLPASKSFVVRTHEDLQTRYELPLYQGERRDATQNEYLGTVIIEGLAPRDAGREIDLELQLDEEATLSISARDGVTGATLDVHLSREVSATEAGKKHDDYRGEAEQPERRLGSPLGHLFQKLRGLFG